MNGNPDIWSHFFVGNIVRVLIVGVLVESGWCWEGNLRSVRDEWLLGSVPVNSVDHGVGKSVNFGIDVLLGDVSSVSLSLVKRWSWRESDLGTVWNEWLLRSVPVDSVDHGVGKTVNLSIDVLLRNISAISLSLIESWGSSWWESNLRSIWDESILTSWPWESFNMLVSEILNIFIDAFLANISVVSLIKSIELWVLAAISNEGVLTSEPVSSLNIVADEVLNIFIHALLVNLMVSILSIKLNEGY